MCNPLACTYAAKCDPTAASFRPCGMLDDIDEPTEQETP